MTRIAILLSAALLTACSATPVSLQGQKVVIVNSMPAQYEQNCRFIDEVVGSQGNWLTGDFTPNKNLAMGARNDLRNAAAKVGANVVQITDSFNSNDEDNSLESVTYVGRAYICR